MRFRKYFGTHRMPTRLAHSLGVCLITCAFFGQFTAAQQLPVRASDASSVSDNPQPLPAPQLADVYKISADDVLDVYVVDVPEYSRTYRVAPDGTVRLPLLNDPIMAAGQTPAALGNVISAKLSESGLLHEPRVLVEVKESRGHAIAVTGAVKAPQNFQLFGRTTLLNVISQAGGIADDASNVAIVRRGDVAMRRLNLTSEVEGQAHGSAGDPATVSIDIRRLLAGDQSENIDLYPGDSVVVQRAGVFYVVGAVNRAGGFVMSGDRDHMTVLKAVALAENLKPTAQSKKAVIIRKNAASPNGAEELPVDVSKILANRAPDSQLIADDVLFVPDSTAKKALHRAGEAAAEAATVLTYGLAIYK
ncbi:MAG: SLBB domain-containing protein [Acidobacteriaceae bacterium]|nr:SLBB domain-containing protein [Acidobacteriaceae bacterium]